MADHEIHAVIGVWCSGGKTFYVLRSAEMRNYPGVWSLLSTQFTPSTFEEHLDLPYVQSLMGQMSSERLGGVPVTVRRYLTSAHCSDNPMRKRVILHMYEVELADRPALNPAYYQEFAWMTPEEYVDRSAGNSCGLCLRMWSDYCVRHRVAERSFAPAFPGDQ